MALHTGCLTVVGMAATWQTAAVIPNFLIQEYQPVMFDTFNRWLAEPLGGGTESCRCQLVEGGSALPDWRWRGNGAGFGTE